MAAGRCNVSSSRKRDVPCPRKDSCSKKNVEFGKLSRGYGVEKGLPHEKKRKVSCDEWSRDDKEVRISSRNRVISTNGSLRLLETVGVAEYGIADESFKKLQNLPGKHEIVANRSVGIYGFEDWRDVAGRGSLCSHKSSSCDGEVGQVKGERVGTWKGLTCRWADELDCAADEDESTCNKVDYEAVMPAASDAEMSSPESGEILGGSGKRWSGREIESCSVELVVSGDEYSVHDLGYVTMEIDENRGEVSGLRQLDSDSEDDDDFRNHDPEVPNCRNMNMLQGCRSAFEYEKLHKISEGTYGIVYKARDKLTGDIVALKKVKMGQNTDGFPITSLREINILMSLRHPTIVDVKEVVMDDRDGVYVVMEYMEHDLKRVMDVTKQPFSQSDVKCLMLQLLEGVKFLHDNWVLHRDLKTSNLLLNNRGELKICDFGMARQYGSPLKPYTPLVVTLWYRAPEILLGAKQYSTAVDMWSVGCIMAEMLAKEALFKGESEIQQLDKIFRVLGTPNEAIWPGFSSLPGSLAKFVKQPYNLLRKKFPAATFTGSPVLTELGIDLLNKLLTYDPEKRITAEEALNHGWFREVPLPKSKEFMPAFPVPYRRR